MSTTRVIDPSLQTEYEALQTLYTASLNRRPIVPLLGAGISVESGYPATSSIMRYLAMVRYFLDKRLYFPDQLFMTERDKELRYESKEHIGRFGWPDPFQLRDDLWNSDEIDRDQKKLFGAIESIYRQWQDDENPDEAKRLRLIHKLFARMTEKEQRDFARASKDRDGLTDDEVRAFLSLRQSPTITPKWRPFLRWVTGRRAEYADSLFHMLNRGRVPGNSHRFLAFLTRVMHWRLILTTNFDDLIERAMRSEGLSPMVFDVWRQAELPNELLVRGSLSVVKLHGSAYGLRVDESLDDPVADHETARFWGYFPTDALLLVIGYGGHDRRIMDLVAAVMEFQSAAGMPPPHVLWTHVEMRCPSHINNLATRFNYPSAFADPASPAMITARINDAGAFLAGLHASYAQTDPASTEAYPAHSQRPLGLRRAEAGNPVPWRQSARSTADPRRDYGEQHNQPLVHVFTGEPVDGTLPEDDCPSFASSIAMSEFLVERASTHTPIWLNTAVHQSVEELVSEVVRQCRKHDVAFPSFVLALRGTHREEQLRTAVNRIYATLRRGSYILALDGIGEFGRPPTTHHGLPASCAEHVLSRVQEFRAFLSELVASAHQCNDSYICLAINDVADRFDSGGRSPTAHQKEAFARIVNEFRSLCDEMRQAGAKSGLVRFHTVDVEPRRSLSGAKMRAELKKLKGERVLSDDVLDDVEALLASFRRPMSRVAVRKLTEDYIKPYYNFNSNQAYLEYFDDLLGAYVANGFLEPIAGDLYWITPKKRDETYNAASSLATSKAILDAVGAPQLAHTFYGHAPGFETNHSAPAAAKMARQVARLTCQHKDIASYYYSDLFLASKDTSAYFEHLYHRISSIRYLTIQDALVFRCSTQIRSRRQPPGPGIPTPVDSYLQSMLQPKRPGRKDRLDDIRAGTDSLARSRSALEPGPVRHAPGLDRLDRHARPCPVSHELLRSG